MSLSSESAKLLYREGKRDDIDSIVRFQILMALETESFELDPETCRRGVAAVFEDGSLGRYFVAEASGDLVGVLMLTYEWSDWRALTVWWIQSVYVARSARRRGIYAGLYAHVKDLALRRGDVGGIRLYVDRRNTGAQEVYARLGMDGEHYQLFEWMKG